MDEQQAASLIFKSGVSTSPMITEVSGRGLGLAIVREKVEKVGGTVSIETQAGNRDNFPAHSAPYPRQISRNPGPGGREFVCASNSIRAKGAPGEPR